MSVSVESKIMKPEAPVPFAPIYVSPRNQKTQPDREKKGEIKSEKKEKIVF